MINRFSLFVIFLLFPFLLSAGIIDSLEQVLRKQTGKDRISTLCELSEELIGHNNERAKALGKEALNLAVDAENDKLIIQSNSALGYVFDQLGLYPEALQYYKEALRVAERSNDSLKIGVACTNVGRVLFSYRADLKESMNYYLRAIEIYKLKGEKERQARTLVNVANLLSAEGNYQGALAYYTDALLYIKNDKSVASIYNNLAATYMYQNDPVKASLMMHKSLEIKERMENIDPGQLSQAYNNLGSILIESNDTAGARKYLEKALAINLKQADSSGIAMNYFNLGNLYAKIKDYKKAEPLILKSYEMVVRHNYKDILSDAYQSLAKLYNNTGDYQKAYEFQLKYTEFKAAFLNSGMTEKLNLAQERFDAQQRELKDKQQNEILAEKNKQQNQFIILLIIGSVLLLLTAFLFLRRFLDKKKANEALENRNLTIEAQKFQIEVKNKEITDSIRYAQRLQDAVLPDERRLLQLFPDAFLLFMPKDIVSGDFFWCTEKNGFVILAVADCTGHGVPGALLSMIGNNLLQQQVHERNLTDPGEILTGVNKGMQHLLRQSQSEVLPGTVEISDGMDIALWVIHKEKKQLLYAGANRPLLLIRNGQIQELQPNRTAIGSTTEENFRFNTQTVNLNHDDLLIAFSDGYADQFGGGKGKKMMLRNLKEQLLLLEKEPCNKHKQLLTNYFHAWKGELEQIDDVLLAGIRVNW